MKVVRKYELRAVGGPTEFSMPAGAVVLCAQRQGDAICLWALVDPNERTRTVRAFLAIGTDHVRPDSERLSYIGTVQLQQHVLDGELVFHVFELLP